MTSDPIQTRGAVQFKLRSLVPSAAPEHLFISSVKHSCFNNSLAIPAGSWCAYGQTIHGYELWAGAAPDHYIYQTAPYCSKRFAQAIQPMRDGL